MSPPRLEVPWAAVQAVVEAQAPWAGGVATWEALLTRFEASRVLWSKARSEAGYRISAVGFLPAVLVLPRGWRAALPPVPERWLIPTKGA